MKGLDVAAAAASITFSAQRCDAMLICPALPNLSMCAGHWALTPASCQTHRSALMPSSFPCWLASDPQAPCRSSETLQEQKPRIKKSQLLGSENKLRVIRGYIGDREAKSVFDSPTPFDILGL
eukprot:scaffold56822_cov20-Tisochrysis_lutea.AAC.1